MRKVLAIVLTLALAIPGGSLLAQQASGTAQQPVRVAQAEGAGGAGGAGAGAATGAAFGGIGVAAAVAVAVAVAAAVAISAANDESVLVAAPVGTTGTR